jgi:hypothetical protein
MTWFPRLDGFGRRHPGWLLLIVLALAAVVVPVLLFSSQPPTVLYQLF